MVVRATVLLWMFDIATAWLVPNMITSDLKGLSAAYFAASSYLLRQIIFFRKSMLSLLTTGRCRHIAMIAECCPLGSPNYGPLAGSGPPARPVWLTSLFQNNIIIRPVKPRIISYLCFKLPTMIILQVTLIENLLQ